MLNLIAGEFAKLKRKKIVPFIILLSLLFPLIVVYTSKMGMGNDTSAEFLKGRFDLSYTLMLGYGLVFLEPCLLGILAFTWILKAGTIYDVGFKLVFSLVFGIEITVATLPIIVFIIYFNKSYLISTLLSFFYAILNWSVVSLVEVNLSLVKVINLFPTLCVMNWSSKKMMGRQADRHLSEAA